MGHQPERQAELRLRAAAQAHEIVAGVIGGARQRRRRDHQEALGRASVLA
jgi:hypothetical protein